MFWMCKFVQLEQKHVYFEGNIRHSETAEILFMHFKQLSTNPLIISVFSDVSAGRWHVMAVIETTTFYHL